MPTWGILLACAMATARAVRLIIADTIADRPRTWLAIHLPTKLVQLLICHWCAGWWISGAVCLYVKQVKVLHVTWTGFPLYWAAVATVAGIVTSWMLDRTGGPAIDDPLWTEEPSGDLE